MAKEQIYPSEDSPFATSISDFSFLLLDRINLDDVITQVLENNVGHLDALRAEIELTRNKGIPDVRDHGNTLARTLLAGVEETVDYTDLITIIKEFKAGIAVRRVALMNNRETQYAAQSK